MLLQAVLARQLHSTSEAERAGAVLCHQGLPTLFRKSCSFTKLTGAMESKAGNVFLSQISVLNWTRTYNQSKTYFKKFSAFWRRYDVVQAASWRNTQLKSTEWSLPQLQILRKPVGSQPWVLFMEVYPCSSWVFCFSHALIFFATDWGTHHVQLLFQAAWSGTRTLSKAYGFPHRHLKCCLAITNQGCLQIFQEEGSSGKGRDLLVRRHAVSFIAQPGLCCCFPHGRQGNLQAVAVLQINIWDKCCRSV